MYTKPVWHHRYNLGSRLKATFRRKLAALQKKNPEITPFTLAADVLTINWWGKAWNANIKNYIPNKTELEKGKLNFRSEALADLKINTNWIEAIVLGSKITPWTVKMSIKPLAQEKWLKIQKQYDQHLESFEKILDHQFPKDMEDLFTNRPLGLFPSSKEMAFECSCSSHNNLCKHTSVVLFALGTKIDADPNLLFTLRGVDVFDLISDSIHTERKRILQKAKTKSTKILKDSNLAEIFGIED